MLAEVGFKEIVLPFESANLRIIKKWCSNKLALDRFNPEDLIKTIKKYKLYVGTNYMLGFPDETRKEIEAILKISTENLKNIPHDLGGAAAIDLLYFLIRYSNPKVVVETGVAAGFSSFSILKALKTNNNSGHYIQAIFHISGYLTPRDI